MKIYLVGGAVRDELLQRTVSERDYVVVGADEAQMVALGYQKVGKDFPVFLHPQTKEEYALARQERKVAKGYTGFECDANSCVTLEEDLLRRDLTINAMAKDGSGEIIDPFHGLGDLKEKVLRHVSEAFVEDPLRVLRVARFLARYATLGFRVAPETNHLMYMMVKNGEVSSLVPERVWQETEKALNEDSPTYYFQALRDCGALEVIFPELNALFGVPATKKWHGEIDTGVHVLMVLDKAAELSKKPEVRFAALMHDLGKASTPFHRLPSHPGHDVEGGELVEQLCRRLRVPKSYQSLAVMASNYHTLIHKVKSLTPGRLVRLLDELDVYRREDRFRDCLLVCQADAQGRIGGADHYPQAEFLLAVVHLMKGITVKDEIKASGKGEEIKQALHQNRVTQLKIWLKEQS